MSTTLSAALASAETTTIHGASGSTVVTADDVARNKPHPDGYLLAAERLEDPMWRLPLWRNYRRFFDSDIADINNAGRGGYAGAIVAALKPRPDAPTVVRRLPAPPHVRSPRRSARIVHKGLAKTFERRW